MIWIGYNLVWHAFQTANRSEARLIAAVLADATGQPEQVASAPSMETSWIALGAEEPAAASPLDTSWVTLRPEELAAPSLATSWIALRSCEPAATSLATSWVSLSAPEAGPASGPRS